MDKPLLICLTPVRNEAWILNTFLKATSLWADYIIISDQGSTDGSREIALRFPKVILFDNTATEMHQSQTRELLFKEASKIDGEKILFTLDPDEFLSGNFMQTDSWTKIINSKKGDLFFFKWINLSVVPTEYIIDENYLYWACNLGEQVEYGEFPDCYIHEWRLPYPAYEPNEIFIPDISFVHFARVNDLRQNNKNRYYQVVTKFKEPSKSIISIYRMYNSETNEKRSQVDSSVYSFYLEKGIDLFKEIDFEDEGKYYTQQIVDYFNINGVAYFSGLDIWDNVFLKATNLKDPRTLWVRAIHFYLKATQKNSKHFIIKSIDKILKKLGV